METDRRAKLRRNRRQPILGRQAQTAVATPHVLSNPEAEVRAPTAPMTLTPVLLHSERTYACVEDIPDGVSDEMSTDGRHVATTRFFFF